MDRNKFLNIIRQIESSGGKNLNHDTINYGIHKGDAAIGEYGIMPKTANEFIRRRELRGQYGPDEALMAKMSPEELREFLKDQDRAEQNLAEDIADRVIARSNGDMEKAAYMWNQGHNKLASSIDDKNLDSSDYVKKFRNIRDYLDKKRVIASEQ